MNKKKEQVRQDVRRLEYGVDKKVGGSLSGLTKEITETHLGCRVHGADIYIQTTKPINPKTGDLWYNVSSLFLPYR